MKKTFALVLVFVFLLAGCSGKTKDAVVDYGSSDLYTEKDIAEAVDLVTAKFRSFEGCELHSLAYAGDETSQKELERQRSQSEKEYTGCIVLNSSFRSPKNGGGAWEADMKYTWSWIIAKEAGRNWVLLDWGY